MNDEDLEVELPDTIGDIDFEALDKPRVLLPCPFCGSAPVIKTRGVKQTYWPGIYYYQAHVECTRNRCSTSTAPVKYFHPSEERGALFGAAGLWNRRAR